MTRAAIVSTLLAVTCAADSLQYHRCADAAGRYRRHLKHAASSSPVTQSDAERMAGKPASRPLRRSPQQGSYHPAYDQSQQAYRAGTGAPPTTMQEQADALSRSSSSPAASKAPIEEAIAATGLGGRGRGPATVSRSRPPYNSRNRPPLSTAMRLLTGGNTVRFLPIIGAPVQASRHSRAARRRGPLARPVDQELDRHSSDYILKGYLSAFSDGGKVTVVYVWDVLDSTGGRLHRIQGQESVPTAAPTPGPACRLGDAANRLEDHRGILFLARMARGG
jgi:hypothetical protein